MVAKLTELNCSWSGGAFAAVRLPAPISIGIGINTGKCCVGNLGSSQRFDYSAIGDEVNVTSRLEGLTKLYGLPVVVGERTASRCPNLSFLEVDLIKVKGRARPTRIFVPTDVLGLDAGSIDFLRPLHEEFLKAYRAQKWDESEILLARCRNAGAKALGAYHAVFASRIKQLRQADLNAGWDGAYFLTEK